MIRNGWEIQRTGYFWEIALILFFLKIFLGGKKKDLSVENPFDFLFLSKS